MRAPEQRPRLSRPKLPDGPADVYCFTPVSFKMSCSAATDTTNSSGYAGQGTGEQTPRQARAAWDQTVGRAERHSGECQRGMIAAWTGHWWAAGLTGPLREGAQGGRTAEPWPPCCLQQRGEQTVLPRTPTRPPGGLQPGAGLSLRPGAQREKRGRLRDLGQEGISAWSF